MALRPASRALLEGWDLPVASTPLAMNRAYEGNTTRRLGENLGMVPVVPPKAKRKAKMGLRPRTLQASERDRTVVPKTQGLPTQLHTVRQLDVMFLGFWTLLLMSN